jgi:hypothetical protein
MTERKREYRKSFSLKITIVILAQIALLKESHMNNLDINEVE